MDFIDKPEPFDKADVWSRLGLFFQESSEREKWQRLYFPDTTPKLFLQWLHDKVIYDQHKRQPVGKAPPGDLFLNGLQIEQGGSNSILRVWVHALCEQRTLQKLGPDEIQHWHVGAVIYFKAVPVSRQRIKLEASCLTPYMARYYEVLLAEIGECWPESGVRETRANPGKQILEAVKQVYRRSMNARRDAEILQRFNEGETRQELADEFNLTVDRIKQILKEQRRKREKGEQQAG